jgi:hypothetical protein
MDQVGTELGDGAVDAGTAGRGRAGALDGGEGIDETLRRQHIHGGSLNGRSRIVLGCRADEFLGDALKIGPVRPQRVRTQSAWHHPVGW